jgi:hypothetical protein
LCYGFPYCEGGSAPGYDQEQLNRVAETDEFAWVFFVRRWLEGKQRGRLGFGANERQRLRCLLAIPSCEHGEEVESDHVSVIGHAHRGQFLIDGFKRYG